MQVKKFEAKTMKEALELVKRQLGPDAIILSAKDNNKAFGLMGDGSVEITAAISQHTLQKKKIAESRLRSEDLEKFSGSTAKVQKQFINKVVSSMQNEQERKEKRNSITTVPYIDIDSDDMGYEQQATDDLREVATKRIQGAARRAFDAFQEIKEDTDVERVRSTAPVVSKAENRDSADEINRLRSEIGQLKSAIMQFKEMPQNFVAPHPGAEYGLPYELCNALQRLINAGIAKEYAIDLLKETKEKLNPVQIKKEALVDAYVAKRILDTIRISDGSVKNKVHFFVGGPGQGKSTALVKIASQIAKEGKKIAILSSGTNKVGATDQMRIYSQILNIPFGVINRATDCAKIVEQLLDLDYIFIDTPGFSLKDLDGVGYLRDLMNIGEISKSVHLVQSVMARDEDVYEIARRYRSTNFDDIIFTSLDESVRYGIIYNFQKKFEVPLYGFGIGQKIPEDFEYATKERVLDLIFKLTKM